MDCSFGGTNYCAPDLSRQQLLITMLYFGLHIRVRGSVAASAKSLALFSTNNNGVIIELPAVLVQLQSHRLNGLWRRYTNKHALGSATKFSLDQTDTLTTFNSTVFSSYIDSGSNAYFFQIQ